MLVMAQACFDGRQLLLANVQLRLLQRLAQRYRLGTHVLQVQVEGLFESVEFGGRQFVRPVPQPALDGQGVRP
ncbi:hypothetical protein D3C84_1079410 [compost metagenome]